MLRRVGEIKERRKAGVAEAAAAALPAAALPGAALPGAAEVELARQTEVAKKADGGTSGRA